MSLKVKITNVTSFTRKTISIRFSYFTGDDLILCTEYTITVTIHNE
jgi:hypothetical protein